MGSRVNSVKEQMARLGLDAYMIGTNENKYYLIGFEDESAATGVDSFLLLTGKTDYLIVECADEERATRIAPECTVLAVADKEPLGVTVKNIVEKEKIKNLGFEGDSLKYKYYSDILKNSDRLTLIPVTDVLEKMRSVKDADELARIAKAIEIGDEVYAYILPLIKPGVREKDIAWEMEAFARKEKGAEGLAFKTIIASGANSALPHGFATEKKIEAGDFVTVDYGVKYNGYCGDMTRTYVVGKPTDKQVEIYNIVLEAQLAGVKAARAGMVAKDLDKVARDIITSRGYGKEFVHELGHSMGVRCHEIPMVGDYDDTVLQPGMIVTVEPGIYLSGWGGVRIEDTVIIEEGGCKILPKTSKELTIL
jgi:Xaa-Pro aminopeptidase